MNKRIGFRDYDQDPEEQQGSEQTNEQKSEDKAIAEFLGANYAPIGSTAQKCFKTTEELVYDLNNIVPVSHMKLAKSLTDAGYRTEYLAGKPYWVMYEKF